MDPKDLHRGNLYFYITYKIKRELNKNYTPPQRIHNPVVFIRQEKDSLSGRKRFRFFDIKSLNAELFFTVGGANSILWDMVENEDDEPI